MTLKLSKSAIEAMRAQADSYVCETQGSNIITTLNGDIINIAKVPSYSKHIVRSSEVQWLRKEIK